MTAIFFILRFFSRAWFNSRSFPALVCLFQRRRKMATNDTISVCWNEWGFQWVVLPVPGLPSFITLRYLFPPRHLVFSAVYHNWKLTFLIFETVSVKNEFDWSPWSACTRTCGFGSYRTRERTCSLSIARKTCIGSEIQKVLCNVPVCPKMEAARPNAIFRQKSTVNTSRYHPKDFRYIFVVNVELAWW